ncbi:MAG: hypothetical protein NTY64_12410 [Deltaproteobacteria bacterium]|nr:hypothetical protein [Deltaproteobacteria bacterium]
MLAGQDVSKQVDAEFGRIFGRQYGLIEAYRCAGADLILVTSGTIASTARVAVDEMRERGKKVGMVKVRLFRPFPREELLEVLAGVEKVAVIDRNVSFGIGGIFAQELRAAFCNEKIRPLVYSYIAGLGGRDVTPPVLYELVEETYKRPEPEAQSRWIGLRS